MYAGHMGRLEHHAAIGAGQAVLQTDTTRRQADSGGMAMPEQEHRGKQQQRFQQQRKIAAPPELEHVLLHDGPAAYGPKDEGRDRQGPSTVSGVSPIPNDESSGVVDPVRLVIAWCRKPGWSALLAMPAMNAKMRPPTHAQRGS
jgi:hypothetical protein